MFPQSLWSRLAGLAIAAAVFAAGHGGPALAQITALKQAIAETAFRDEAIATFYKEAGYTPIWVGRDAPSRARRAAFLAAVEIAPHHGLPAGRYDPGAVRKVLANIAGDRALGRAEVELSRMLLDFARDLQSGVLVPGEVDSGIKRRVSRVDRTELLRRFRDGRPAAFFRDLPPDTPEYIRLMKEKMRLGKVIARGGWGPEVAAGSLAPGDAGEAVVTLRNRLVAMGYMARSASMAYDAALEQAVRRFQIDHGLEADGVAGELTIAAVNVGARQRLQSIVVAMERERWTNMDRGKRHVWVNLVDFSAAIIDDGKVIFKTRSVVGKDTSDRRSPEFSDVMEHLVINPTWHVPRSIATKEYLPMMQRDRNAASHLRLVDSRGRTVPRNAVNFRAYTARTFPFSMKQPPSSRNALGLVKFIFPNRWNIYLHDTPSKSLFGRVRRDFSHGCIRLADPFEFAYRLLAPQTDDPKGFFHAKLNAGYEDRVELEQHVAVHIVYRTAFTDAKGRAHYRPDIYGRDGRIFDALAAAGVVLDPPAS